MGPGHVVAACVPPRRPWTLLSPAFSFSVLEEGSAEGLGASGSDMTGTGGGGVVPRSVHPVAAQPAVRSQECLPCGHENSGAGRALALSVPKRDSLPIFTAWPLPHEEWSAPLLGRETEVGGWGGAEVIVPHKVGGQVPLSSLPPGTSAFPTSDSRSHADCEALPCGICRCVDRGAPEWLGCVPGPLCAHSYTVPRSG